MTLEGILVPHITPFTRGGDLDETALRTCVRFWLEGGVSGLVPCGSNGEGPYLSREERKRIIKAVVDEVNGKVPVVAGTGSMSTKETTLFTEDAKDLGADAALVVTPYYFKLSGREMHEHYKTLCEAVDLPIVLYSVPKFTSYSLEPNMIQQLASECKNVVGVKDSGGNIGTITETIRLVGDRISVLAGTADVILPTLMLGGKGAVVAVANAFPRMCSELYDAFKRKDLEEASGLQRQVAYLNDVLVKKYNQLSSIKEAMKLLGLPAGYPRRPALPLKDDEKSDIAKALKAYA
jgi:4-hydroxy-tetrahydrodipicolinate synthase